MMRVCKKCGRGVTFKNVKNCYWCGASLKGIKDYEVEKP